MTDTNDKLRAVLFAAMMVLWVFAGAVAFGGSVAAQSEDVTEPSTVDATGYWYSDATQNWQGQQLIFRPTGNVETTTYSLYTFNNETAEGPETLQKQLSFASDGNESYAVIDTSSLEGQYVITRNGSRAGDMIYTDADGTENTNNRGSYDAPVSIIPQDLNTSFSSSSANLDGNSTIEVSSRRDGFNLSVTSDNLTQTELNEVFSAAPNDVGVEDSDEDDSAVILSGVASTDEIEANFDDSNFDSGSSVTFDFGVTDTTASDSASTTIGDSVGQDAEFTESIFQENRGDTATISLTTQQVASDETINLTVSDGDNVLSHLYVQPDEDGEINLEVDAYNFTRTETVDDVYDGIDGTQVVNVTGEDNSTTELAAGSRVVDAGTYDLVASETDFSDDSNEYAISTLEITERATESMTIYTAPNTAYGDLIASEDSLSDYNEAGAVTEDSTIAIAEQTSERSDQRGDTILFEVVASGIFSGVDDGALGDSDHLNLTLVEQNPGSNEDPNRVNFTSSGASHSVLTDEANDTVYVAVRSEEFGAFDEEYEAQFNVSSDYLSNFSRDTVDDDESVSGEFSLVDREAEFDTTNEQVVVSASADQVISGTTTVAPGTEMRVRARADAGGQQSFLKSAETTVQEDGSFEATFSDEDSFADVQSGTNFTASINSQSFADNVQTDGQVGEGETASVSVSDVSAEEGENVSTVTVDSASLPNGGFVTIHDGTYEDGAAVDSVRGSSEYLSAGEHSDVEITLNESYSEEGDIIAVAYRDSNGNEAFDAEEDSAYPDPNGDAVTASASVTFGASTPTPTEGTATPGNGEGDGADGQTGFGAVIALVALLGAALLAARRKDF